MNLPSLSLPFFQSVLTQTDPPPGNAFSDTASLWKIYDAYEKDYTIFLAKQREIEKEKEKEEEKKRGKSGKSVSISEKEGLGSEAEKSSKE